MSSGWDQRYDLEGLQDMSIITRPMTVAQLRALIDKLPDDTPVYVHGSNGWGPGAARALHKIDRDRYGAHLYGSYL